MKVYRIITVYMHTDTPPHSWWERCPLSHDALLHTSWHPLAGVYTLHLLSVWSALCKWEVIVTERYVYTVSGIANKVPLYGLWHFLKIVFLCLGLCQWAHTYFGDCAWKLNLARAAFICADEHLFDLVCLKIVLSNQTSEKKDWIPSCPLS